VSTQTVQTAGVAAMPRVNLMPPEIAEAARFRQLQVVMGGAVVLSAVLVGGLYMHTKSGIADAQAQLTAAQAQQTSLHAKLTSLSSVSETYASVQAKQTVLQQAMGSEIRWSYLLNDLSFRIPSNVWLTSISATETSDSSAASTAATTTLTPIAGAPVTVGTVAFSGVAFKHNDVATWLDSLAKEKGFADPAFSSSAEDQIGARGVVDFGSSVTLTEQSLSNRYVPKAGS
jgi:Tfp pilus assembly protein PilN